MKLRSSTGSARRPEAVRLTHAALAVISLSVAGRVLAQDQAASSSVLPTVTVTANKRAEPQREIAGSVSSVDGAEMERRGTRDQEDVFKLTPGVQFTKGDPSGSAITIRGLGTAGCSICGGVSQGTTGIYLEDVPLTDPYGAVSVVDLAPFDLDRIEILRGPQGALYGSSSLGGAVRYLVNKATPVHPEASVLLTGNKISGGAAGYSAYGMYNAPLSTSAAVRVVAFDRKDGGYIDNLGTGRNDANELRQRGGRISGVLKATPDLVVTATLLTETTSSDDSFGVSPNPERLERDTPSPSTRKARFDFGSLQIAYDLGAAQLTSITGLYRKEVDTRYDSTRLYGNIGAAFGLPALPIVTDPSSARGRGTSQELRLSSNGAGPLTWVAGLFYQRTSYSAASAFLAPGGEQAWGPAGAALIPGDVLLTGSSDASSTEKAVFADTEYALGNGWSIGLGGRAYRTTIDFNTSYTFFGSGSTASPSSSDHGFTPKATVKYLFGDSMWYALVSQGYRFGGANAVAPFKPYRSDKLWNYETGLRLQPAKNWQLDLTVFLMDWSNAQVTAYDTSGAAPVAITANIGKARNEGLELASRWKATRSFEFDAALAYTHARTASDFPSGAIPGNIIASGSRLPSTPDWQTALSASYLFDGPAQSRGRAFLTHTFLGARVMDIDGLNHASGYGTVDAGLSFVRDPWTLSLGVSNLFDKRGTTGIIGGLPGIPYVDYYLQRPRTVSVSLRWDL